VEYDFSNAVREFITKGQKQSQRNYHWLKWQRTNQRLNKEEMSTLMTKISSREIKILTTPSKITLILSLPNSETKLQAERTSTSLNKSKY
jgi:hypothetical protein